MPPEPNRTQTRSSLPRLPPELIDLAFTNLLPDPYSDAPSKADLRACSLVCRAWHEISLPHLFNAISCIFTDGTPNPSGALSLATFRAALEASPALCACARKLRLTACPPPSNQPDDSGNDGRVDVALCAAVLHLLPRLHTVRFENVLLAADPSRTLPAPRIRPCVQTVEIANPHMQQRMYVEDTLRLVDLFDAIDMLRVQPGALQRRCEIYRPGTRVGAISTCETDFPEVVTIISMLRVGQCLRSLHLDVETTLDDDFNEWEHAEYLLESLGPELTHFGLTIRNDDGMYIMSPPGFETAFPLHAHRVTFHFVCPDWHLPSFHKLLRSCPNLDSLVLHFDMSHDPRSLWHADIVTAHNRAIWAMVAELCASVPTTAHSLVFGLGLYVRPAATYMRPAQPSTKEVEATLGKRFGKVLPMLTFLPTYGRPFDEEEQGCLKELFPVFAQEGKVEFSDSKKMRT